MPACDFDFLVEFGPLPQGGYADACFGLREGLEALLGAPVDLVVGSAIRNPYFRQSVEPAGRHCMRLERVGRALPAMKVP